MRATHYRTDRTKPKGEVPHSTNRMGKPSAMDPVNFDPENISTYFAGHYACKAVIDGFIRAVTAKIVAAMFKRFERRPRRRSPRHRADR